MVLRQFGIGFAQTEEISRICFIYLIYLGSIIAARENQHLMIDTLISLGIVVVIFFSTWRLLKESLYLSLDAVPENVNLEHIEKHIADISGIESWHHLHIWAVSTTENAATLHVVIQNLQQMESIKKALKTMFRNEGVQHSTIECELSGTPCSEIQCS